MAWSLTPGGQWVTKPMAVSWRRSGHRGASEGWMQSKECPVRPGTPGLRVGMGVLCTRAARAGVLRDPVHSSMKGEQQPVPHDCCEKQEHTNAWHVLRAQCGNFSFSPTFIYPFFVNTYKPDEIFWQFMPSSLIFHFLKHFTNPTASSSMISLFNPFCLTNSFPKVKHS